MRNVSPPKDVQATSGFVASYACPFAYVKTKLKGVFIWGISNISRPHYRS